MREPREMMTVYAMFACYTALSGPQHGMCVRLEAPAYSTREDCRAGAAAAYARMKVMMNNPNPSVRYTCMKSSVPTWTPA